MREIFRNLIGYFRRLETKEKTDFSMEIKVQDCCIEQNMCTKCAQDMLRFLKRYARIKSAKINGIRETIVKNEMEHEYLL